MATANDIQSLVQKMLQGQSGEKPMSAEELKALSASRAPLGPQVGGANTGGRHDPRMGGVANEPGSRTLMQPPSLGRNQTAGQSSWDEGMLDMIGDQIGMGGKGDMPGVDVGNMPDQNTLIQQGLQAVTAAAKGQVTPQTRKAAMQLVFAVQSGVVPSTPEITKLISAMKSAKLLTQSNVPSF